MSKRTKTSKKNELEQISLQSLLLDNWKLVATSIFKWSGFQSDFISDEIERRLYEDGSVVFFVDKEDGVQKVLRYAQQGKLNVYGIPTKWTVIGLNGYSKNLDDTNSVMIWNNKFRKPTLPYVKYIVANLVNIDQAIKVNVNAIKTPFIFEGDEKQLLTFKNMYRDISNNEPVLYLASKANLDNTFKAHNTGVEYQGKNLTELYDAYQSRLLTFLGLKSVKSDKKERLVVDEANQNEEFKNIFFASQYDMRKQACKLINEMYGLSVNVEINPLLREEKQDNGKLHNDNSGND